MKKGEIKAMEILKFIQILGSSQRFIVVCCATVYGLLFRVPAVSKLLIPSMKLFGITLLLYRCVKVLAFSCACAYGRFGATYCRHGVRVYSLAVFILTLQRGGI